MTRIKNDISTLPRRADVATTPAATARPAAATAPTALPASAASSFQTPSDPKSNPAVPVGSTAPAQLPPASALHFSTNLPEVQAFANSKGWNLPGQKVGLIKADLVYTTDNWKTTKTAPLQYLYNNTQGFLLRDVPPGTQIEYAIHAEVGVSHDGFYSYDDQADVWFNNGGGNYHGSSTDPMGF